MARPPSSERYELSDQERRDLIKLIETGKPLPERYRFLLFDDKREVELTWAGKTRDVCTAVLPFQTLEHIDEPRKEGGTGVSPVSGQSGMGGPPMSVFQPDLIDTTGRQLKGWTNKLIWGDNKLILSSLKSGALRRQIEDAGGLKLIYIDPPFDVGADFSMDIEIGGETFHKEPNILEQIAYRDTWGRGADSFIAMIYERLILMRDLMARDAIIYLHCDWHMSHYARAVLSEVFGDFQNEIIWQKIRVVKAQAKSFGNIHDSIFVFSKGNAPLFNRLQTAQEPEYEKKFDKTEPITGRRYQLVSMLQAGGGPARRFGEMVLEPGPGRHWIWSQDRIDNAMAQGLIEFTGPGKPRKKQYLDESGGRDIADIWDDIFPVNSQAIEDTGYATQKPETLLERIIRASSNPGDLVADFFCGSGTTAAVAEKLGRKWIATDLGKFGIHTTRKRLIGVQRELKAAGQDFRAFEVLNLGRYERQAYLNLPGNLSAKKKSEAFARKEREFRDLILRAYRAAPLENEPFFHGQHAGRLVVVGPINLPVGRLFIEEVITECRKRGASRADILAFEFEMGLFPAVLAESKAKGIDLAPKTIPPEVFDKRAVDKGQVRFADVAYIEATPRYDKKDKLTVALELTDFSVYYSQGFVDAVTAELKAGKSEVVCEQGKLIKLSKDKNEIITREVLTKKWTDWVDYWAVDFNYESRREIIKVPRNFGVSGELPGVATADGQFIDFEEQWTGNYIFENEWQSFRTRQSRDLELKTVAHTYAKPGRYTVAIKVIDIFGNDTMTLVPVTVG
jgi:site-specific DNA-methyltransferase (adenine-specific)/adenine-specific DNA-methyltransferase